MHRGATWSRRREGLPRNLQKAKPARLADFTGRVAWQYRQVAFQAAEEAAETYCTGAPAQPKSRCLRAT